MSTLSVFIIWNTPLFLSSMKLILMHSQVQWVGDSEAGSDYQQLIIQAKPNIVLIEGEEAQVTSQAMEILQFEPGDIRIVGLSMVDNQVKLFEVEHGLILKKGDLLRMIFKERNI